VLTSAALVGDDSPATNFVGLVNPNEILWNRGDVILNTSTNAGIVMDSDPEAIGPIVSMFQSDTIALKALRRAAWFAKSGATGFFNCAY